MSNAQQDSKVGALLNLQEVARHAQSADDLGFVMVNSTHEILPFRQAILWTEASGIKTQSGIVAVDRNAPFAQWLTKVFKSISTDEAGTVEPNQLPEKLVSEWGDWLAQHAYWQPLSMPNGKRVGGLLFVRDTPFSEQERDLLAHISGCYAHAWAALNPTPAYALWNTWLRKSKRRLTITAGLVVVVLLFPVRLTVLAPAETVPVNPSVIRSQLDGVVEQVLVRPNENVKQGQPVVMLDPVSLKSRLEVAQRTFSTTITEYRQAEQRALASAKGKTELAIIRGRIEEKRSEVAFIRAMLDRVILRSPIDGVVMIDDPVSWQGRPVSTGERIMMVAAEKDTEIEAWLSIGDIIPLQADADITVYLNVAPLSSIPATLKTLSYLPEVRPDQTMAYRVRATIKAGQQRPRAGLMGTAKIAGKRVPLVYYVFRRPLAIIRQFLGV